MTIKRVGVLRAVLMTGYAVGAIVTAPDATAQTAPQTTAEPPSPQTADAAPPVEDTADIVVTAQRRSERVKDVPLSVAAFTGEQLASAGVTGSRELATAIPGVQIQATGGFVQPNIRGIGTVQASAGSESNIALYVDGVYMPNQTFNVFDLEDLESIQVLKGPQGSLYGRNATGGAILISTRRPADRFELKANVGYGSFDEVTASAYLTGPITSNFKASLSALYRDDNGYGRDVLRGTRLQSYHEFHARAKLLFEPDAATSILLSGDYGRVRDDTTLALQIWNRNTNFPALNPVIPAAPHDYALSFNPVGMPSGYGGSIDISRTFGSLTLKSLSAYRHVEYKNLGDSDRISEVDTRIDVFTRQRYYTQELTLSSDSSGPLRWLVGGYYINDRTFNPTYSISGTTRTNVAITTIQAESYAGFFEATYDVTPRLSALIGGRYSSETRSSSQSRPTGTPLTAFQEGTQSQFTPKASLIYKLTDTTNVYATYNKGFKSGAFVSTAFNTTITKPETVDGYEIGAKFAHRGASVNAAAFYYNYNDIQYSSRTTAGLILLQNAARAKIYGFDVAAIVPLGSDLEARVGGAYTHSEYTSFLNPPVLAPRNANGTGGNIAVTGVDVTGNPLIRTPKFTANAALAYAHTFTSGQLGVNGSLYYNSGFSWLPEGRLFQRGYVLVNGEVSWTIGDGAYRVSLWGKNLTNTLYATSASITANDAIAYQRPRSYGIALTARWR